MQADRPRGASRRAIIAVIALYALCLQAILGTAVPLSPPGVDPALCLHEAGEAGPDAPAPVHVHVSCCTAAQAVASLDLPSLVPTGVVWPSRRRVAVAWRPHAAAQPRAPPERDAQPRAPPVA
ncbi:hypothetical protein ASF27_03525 [Methylobacterium sp. Leaf102]|uniref:hypothetical protein n=1 Tax=Methylobacterium sp. Leaf102 TaxID=1736253 RepID=UPI0007023548|nr:hypothetical protein [Methylobacterium sp. Leaf102]KQP34620.1 hypothetical protein ASF27_03525 [Methylobacterium sp. Leaf102]KQP72026.1 hypothetical protein ASF52_00345 [Methylobacterium sp. Leaf112]